MKKFCFTPLSLACALAVFSASALQAKDIHEPGESAIESQAKVEIVRHQVSQAQPIREAAFVYDLNRDRFDLAAFLDQQAPHLKPHQEAILHWSGFASVHPRIVLALMEARSQVISQPTEAALEQPFGSLSTEQGFNAQLGDVVTRLSQRFYNLKEQQKSSPWRPTDQADPASLVLASAMAENHRSIRAQDPLQTFKQQYTKLFPEAADALVGSDLSLQKRSDKALDSHTENAPQWNTYYSRAVPPDDMMQMPWRQGYWWIPNGAHANTGSGFPLSSIDVSYDWPRWYGRTYSVAAAHSGYVRVFSRCQVRVTNPNGWATNYYHLEGVQVQDGQWVNRNTKLANYADDRNSALCQGGSSTGPHLHFSLLYNGYYQSLQGVNLGPYKIDVGRWSYDDNCYNFWLYNEREGRYICAWNSIYNYGTK